MTNKQKIIIVVLVFVFLGFLTFLLASSSQQKTNPGGTGGDYIPEYWVVVRDIPAGASLTSDQEVALQTKFIEFVKQHYNNPSAEYIATYKEGSLNVSGEKYVSRASEMKFILSPSGDIIKAVVINDLINATFDITLTKEQ